jgi:FixJ family two-component response regulator
LADIRKTLAEDHKYALATSPISVHPLRLRIGAGERDTVETDRKAIIVVDDDPVMRQALAAALTSLGHRVQSFASASAFFAVAAKTEAACLILDIQLGSESGIELAKQLAANRFNFPIIFMSGSDDERLRRSALDAGAVTFLSKPFRIEDLMLALSKAIVAQ